MQKIIPYLWYDNQAEEAANFYVSVFKNSKILSVARYGEAGTAVSGKPKGSVMTVSFELDGQQFAALNGGPHFTFSPAYPSWWTARRRRKWTTCGRSCPRAEP